MRSGMFTLTLSACIETARSRVGPGAWRRLPKPGLIAGVSILAGMVMSMNAAAAEDVVGWMQVNPADRQIGITAHAYGPDAAKIEFELRVERVGRSGKTATKQSGKADMQPGKIAQLSTTSVNMSAGDQLAILLTITSGGKVVATNALHVGPH